MMSEKTVSNNFARQGVLENKKHGLFFVGYADSETPGGRIRAAQPGDKVLLDPAYPPVPLNCEVRVFDFSGHSTRDAIADYAVRVKPKKIFLVHGDDGAMAWFKGEFQNVCRVPKSSSPCRVWSMSSEALKMWRASDHVAETGRVENPWISSSATSVTKPAGSPKSTASTVFPFPSGSIPSIRVRRIDFFLES